MFDFQHILLLVSVGQMLLHSAGAGATCYWPDQSVAPTQTPCNSAKSQSHCCNAQAVCLDNGYCLNQEVEYGNRISRGGCTDRSWDSDECPQYCQTALPDEGITLSLVQDSGKGLFCCGLTWNATSQLCLLDSKDGDPQPFSLQTGLVIYNRTSGSTTLDVASSTNSSDTASPVAVASSNPSNIGTAVGAGIGASFGVLLIGAALLPYWLSRRRRTHEGFQQFESFKTSYPPSPQPQQHIELLRPVSELQSAEVQELDGRR